MRPSRTLCILVSAMMLFSSYSCGRSNKDNHTDSNISATKDVALFSGFVTVPNGKDDVRLHEDASESSKEIAPALLNDTVEVYEEKGDWYLVSIKGFKGYIKKEYISLTRVADKNKATTTTTTVTTTVRTTTTTETTTSTSTTTTTTTTAAETKPKTEETTSKNEEKNQPEEQVQVTPTHPVEYPSIAVTLNIDPYNGDPEKYELSLNVTGKFSHYKYEAYRVYNDGHRDKLASGESSDRRISLAVHDSLLKEGARDIAKVTPYLDSVEGDPLELEVYEPEKTW